MLAAIAIMPFRFFSASTIAAHVVTFFAQVVLLPQPRFQSEHVRLVKQLQRI